MNFARCMLWGAALILAAQTSLLAQAGQQPASRVVAPVSDAIRTTLKGNVHPLAKARYDHGAAAETLPTGRMMLLLRRSQAQTTLLRRYLDEVQNPASPLYRKWLTPEVYGARYGISDADLEAVKGWLEAQGFRVESVPKARNVVVFSGTIGLVRAAFHTSIHSYVIEGVQHYANASDPQIPAALAPVVAGISPLNDFRAKPQHQVGPAGIYDAQARRIKPQLTLRGGSSTNPVEYLYVDPADAATIYNTPNLMLNRDIATTEGFDGTNVTIGILGYSDLAVQDVQNYRSVFLNDNNPSHLPQTIVDGRPSGVLPGGYAIEALLDNEIAGGIAPGAAINYYSAASTNLADGLQLAGLRAVDDNAVSILSVSYGNCEADLGASGNLFFSELWQQAAAQGISVVVSSGDAGSAGCDDDNTELLASRGLAVNGIASTPYNIAVGGTDFDVLPSNFAKYAENTTGGAPPYYGTALGYIPESTWNNSVASDGLLSANTAYRGTNTGATNIVVTGGGISSAAVCSTAPDSDGHCPGTLAGYAKPAFQNSLTGKDGVRDIPDVSLFAANGKYQATWVLCSDSFADGNTSQSYTNCQTNNGVLGGNSNFDGVGGTSAAAPAFAGMLALVSQSQGSERLGQASTVLYSLASGSSASTIFHTVQGNNSVPCVVGSPDCLGSGFLSGYNAGAGYNEAIGLGSLDAAALVKAWSTAVFTSTSTSLAVGASAKTLGTGGISVTHGTPLYFAVGVTPAGAVGSVTVTNTSGVANNAASSSDTVLLGNDGNGTFSANNLPGGTYTISAYYAGDATHAASSSEPISVTVAPEESITVLSLVIYNPTTNERLVANTMPFGYYAYLDAQPYGAGSTRDTQGNIILDGIPSGYLEFTYPGAFITSTISSAGSVALSLSDFGAYTYNFEANYNGDASFLASSSNTIPLTILPAVTTLSLSSSADTIAPSGSVTVVATLQANSVWADPSNPITLTTGGAVFQVPDVDSRPANGTVQVQATFVVPGSLLASGANTLTVALASDGNYQGSMASTVVTVDPKAPAPAFTVAGPSGGISIAAPGQAGTGIITLAPVNGFNGAVALSCSVSAATSGVTPTCSVPQSVTITGTGSATAVLSVSTTAGSAQNSTPFWRLVTRGGGVALGCLLLFAMPGQRPGWRGVLGLLLVAGGVGAIGCGGSSSGSGGNPGAPGTPVGSYTVTVSGTSGTVTASTQVAVRVQ